jgi:hypothetical protein
MSEGNTQIVLHDESLDKIVAMLRGERRFTLSKKREIANTIEAQR